MRATFCPHAIVAVHALFGYGEIGSCCTIEVCRHHLLCQFLSLLVVQAQGYLLALCHSWLFAVIHIVAYSRNVYSMPSAIYRPVGKEVYVRLQSLGSASLRVGCPYYVLWHVAVLSLCGTQGVSVALVLSWFCTQYCLSILVGLACLCLFLLHACLAVVYRSALCRCSRCGIYYRYARLSLWQALGYYPQIGDVQFPLLYLYACFLVEYVYRPFSVWQSTYAQRVLLYVFPLLFFLKRLSEGSCFTLFVAQSDV